MAAEDFKQFWDGYAFYYTRLNLSPVHQRFVSDTCQAVAAGSGEAILDLGCGPGIIAKALAKCGAQVTAVDYSEAMLKFARDGAAGATQLSFVHADAFEYLKTLSDRSFDVVLASLFISYVDGALGRAAVLAEIFRVLRPGGRLIMSNPKPDAEFSRVFWKSGWTALRHIVHAVKLLRYAGQFKRYDQQNKFHFLSKTETVALLRGAGFQIDADRDVSSSLADTVYLSVACKPALARGVDS